MAELPRIDDPDPERGPSEATSTGRAIGDLTPVDLLVDALARTVPVWLERCVVETVESSSGSCPDHVRRAARVMATEAGSEVVRQIDELVRADAHVQRGTPLTILRSAVRYPTAILAAADVPVPGRDAFAEQHFPEDRYGLSPASWSDVHPELHEVGLMWGAWKAAIVLQQRRDSAPGPTMS